MEEVRKRFSGDFSALEEEVEIHHELLLGEALAKHVVYCLYYVQYALGDGLFHCFVFLVSMYVFKYVYFVCFLDLERRRRRWFCCVIVFVNWVDIERVERMEGGGI